MPERKDVPPRLSLVDSSLIISEDFLWHGLPLCEQPSLYSAKRNPFKVTNMTVIDLEQFMDIVLTMFIMRLPQTRMYWSEKFRIGHVVDTMTRNRWEESKKFLYLNDNQEAPDKDDPERDRLYKVRPPLDQLIAKCREL
ncbi:hypothetical protein MRX96_017224 [Rhipicephalus microplus]